MARKDKAHIFQLRNRNLISLTAPKSPITEQFRTVRTSIEFSSVDKDLSSIVVTSPSPGEGKSTITANLAIVFAQQGKRVLLIDTDLRKPTVHYTFHMENLVGITNILTKQATLGQAVQATGQENLQILTSGPIPPNPSELLSSKSMKNLLETAKNEYDLVIFDTPPVLAVTDAQILSHLTDGVVLVISSENTQKDSAKKAKELLESAQAKLLGVVLNNKKEEDNLYYYYGK
ncbi:CpsD/CapB family tyrosine-protein kinase [Priestia megaterium]|uniref:CpsD/CapB family tyrosine-protein kinase n=1 Tax=Priestia megaterium TaxID=1404 RepID=UPI002730BFD1|nr:CpsD/CapB family tyrosine-protein kinase [Priestia megaterium]MDP1443095.1 CpsD/CapB family tyrosine-protein kinase [Priestia megaterium]MDP1472239.1 CpsD/CapB family tyrosine-protein kinase [Priestia megaterium]MED4268343.1 CpsD/CapB family tyrosine-protein kinase [Priestia megaterium]MED4279922.1 CpsD/CapB family tyrosine-protein kinase [Priestia megaterium]MED4319274.1 CpsD/CapB family tyrosine-protein kinase [Priestia megaterium]